MFAPDLKNPGLGFFAAGSVALWLFNARFG